jgi:hypothetical protein
MGKELTADERLELLEQRMLARSARKQFEGFVSQLDGAHTLMQYLRNDLNKLTERVTQLENQK